MSLSFRISVTSITTVGKELPYIKDAIEQKCLSGKGKYSRLCEEWLERRMEKGRAFVVSSCTSALEMAAILANILPGDEIILPSYTYVSTANAFVLRGAVPVFVGIDEGSMNIDVTLIESAITPKTRAIVPVHYAGIACDMDRVMTLAEKYGLFVCEDAAMACTSTHRGRMLGTFGHVGCISFQEKKNFTAAAQGGALLVNDVSLAGRAETIYEQGTDRARFMRREVMRYEWQDLGVNATLSELQAAFLYAQLEAADKITRHRQSIFQRYHTALLPLAQKGHILLPEIPRNSTHNANVFYIRVQDKDQRGELIRHLQAENIEAYPQFMPLHVSPYGQAHARFVGSNSKTIMATSQILLLPLHMALTRGQQDSVIQQLFAFWGETE